MAHPVFYATGDEFSDMLLFMFIGRYFCAVCAITGVNEQMRIFPERDLP